MPLLVKRDLFPTLLEGAHSATQEKAYPLFLGNALSYKCFNSEAVILLSF